MPVSEALALRLFLLSVGSVYAITFGLIVSRFIRRSRASRWERIALNTFGTVSLMGILCGVHGYFIEPYWLEVTHRIVKSAKIPKGKAIRIVQISDFHCDPRARLEEKIPAVILNEKPDLIFFTGDALNSKESLPIFKKALSEIAKIAPTYVIRGNWDVWYWRNVDLFKDTGAKHLHAHSEEGMVKGVPIRITGADFDSEALALSKLRSTGPEGFSIFLTHTSDFVEELPASKVDLYLAGHTHGGQVALPFYGAVITLSKHGKKYEQGLYQVNETWLNVNRGIGMEGGSAPRVRFWSRPEVTVIDVLPPT